MTSLLEITSAGLYCPSGDFYVDPWQPVTRAVITHAHSDHARPGSARYLTADRGLTVLRERVGYDSNLQGVPYGEPVEVNGVRVSFHPAGHLLGSAQVRIEHLGEVVVISGDYKTEPDPTCEPLEPLRCHTFVTESTFGLPIYRWRASDELAAEINAWWRDSQQRGRTCVLFAYALGKAQRVLSGLDPSIGPILVHGAVARFLKPYREAGIALPPAEYADAVNSKAARGKAMVIAPPSASGGPWIRKFGAVSTAMASGWMQIRGARRRRSMDRGFALSDHADWEGLLATIRATEAQSVWVTHGYTREMVRWLQENGWQAQAIATRFEGEVEDADAAEPEPTNQPDLNTQAPQGESRTLFDDES